MAVLQCLDLEEMVRGLRRGTEAPGEELSGTISGFLASKNLGRFVKPDGTWDPRAVRKELETAWFDLEGPQKPQDSLFGREQYVPLPC